MTRQHRGSDNGKDQYGIQIAVENLPQPREKPDEAFDMDWPDRPKVQFSDFHQQLLMQRGCKDYLYAPILGNGSVYCGTGFGEPHPIKIKPPESHYGGFPLFDCRLIRHETGRSSMAHRPVKCGVLITAFAFGVAAAPAAMAQEANQPSETRSEELDVRVTFEGGLNAVAEENLFWNLAETFAPTADFNSDTQWLEAYIKPGIVIESHVSSATTVYAGGSFVASMTTGQDGLGQSNNNRLTSEEAYIGLRIGSSETGELDLSIGAQTLKLGTGMQIANGASNGFERGAVKLGPRKAWERTAIAKFSLDGLTARAFYLDPNELASNDTGTEIVGGDLRYDWDGDFIGATYVNLIESGAPYPQAAPGGFGPPAFLNGGVTVSIRFHSTGGYIRSKMLFRGCMWLWMVRISGMNGSIWMPGPDVSSWGTHGTTSHGVLKCFTPIRPFRAMILTPRN